MDIGVKLTQYFCKWIKAYNPIIYKTLNLQEISVEPHHFFGRGLW